MRRTSAPGARVPASLLVSSGPRSRSTRQTRSGPGSPSRRRVGSGRLRCGGARAPAFELTLQADDELRTCANASSLESVALEFGPRFNKAILDTEARTDRVYELAAH